MARKERNTWVIYPEYFDTKLSRSDCRKVPMDLAVNSPKAEEISKILRNKDIPNRVEDHKHHPATWYKERGRIIMNKQDDYKKEEFLRSIGKGLKRLRS